MKRNSVLLTLSLTLALAFALGVAGYAPLRAQVPTPQPSVDPHLYTDPGVTFEAPSNAYLLGIRRIPVSALGENPATVAGWIIDPKGEDAEVIQMQFAAFTGTLDGFDGTYEDEARAHLDSALFRDKQHVALKNGMPAYWLSMTSGSGFNAHKTFAYMWIDGTRGAVLSVTASVGEISEAQAHKALDNVSAVRYPIEREQSGE